MAGVLWVDLSTGQSWAQELPDAHRRHSPGFGLLGVELLLGKTEPGLSAYHSDQLVVFGVGAVAGRHALALPRMSVVSKSPLSGGIAESRVEGPFGPAVAASGHDAIVLTGRAQDPCYLVVENGQARLHAASQLWGMDTAEVTDFLVARHGPGTHVAAIGPAGENLVRFASIVTDRGFMASRMGLGAVLGAKNCKAVVLVGGVEPTIDDPVAVARITDDYVAAIVGNPLTRSQHEPPGFGTWPAAGLEGYLGVRNYSTTLAGNLAGLTTDAYIGRLSVSSGGCPGCSQDCLKSFQGGGILHQEAVAAFAGNLAIADLDAVLDLNARCQQWGVDPVSLAGVLAFRCELAERKLLSGPEFGHVADLTSMAAGIVYRRGLGADGVARLARQLGPRTTPYALHSKGIELCGFDPRGCQGLALAYAVHPLGPRYDAVEHDIDFDPVAGSESFIANAGLAHGLPMTDLSDGKVNLVADLMELWSGYDAVGLCLFAAPPTRNLTEDTAAELVSAVSGWQVTPAGIREWGRRRLQLMRRYNLREGLTSADDTLPDRFFTLPVDGGRLAGAVLDRARFEAAAVRLRNLLGWV